MIGMDENVEIKNLAEPKRSRWFLGLALILLVAIGYTWATWVFFTERVPGGNDFLAHYSVWEAYFRYGYSPYSDEAALFTQQRIYGRPASPEEDQNRLTYPFYSFIIHAPFILLKYSLARAIYMTMLQAALFLGAWMSLKLVNWKPEPWLVGVLFAWTLLFYPEARGVILGQFAIFGFLSMVACLYFLRRKWDIWAGITLVLSTVKPTLVFLVIPFLLLFSISRRRFAFLTGFLVSFSILAAGSFLMLPRWFDEWIHRMSSYSDYTVGQSPVWLFTHKVFPIFGGPGEIGFVILLLIGMVWSWWRVFQVGGDYRFFWTLGITLVISSLIVPRSATTNYVMMLGITIWFFAALDRMGFKGRVVFLLCMVSSFIGYWWLHITSVIGNQEQAVMFFPYPIAIGLILVLNRKWLLKDAERNIGVP